MGRRRPLIKRADGTLSVELSCGLVSVIDARDRGIAERCNWFNTPSRGGNPYARTTVGKWGAEFGLSRGSKVFLHRLILGIQCKPELVSDHINGDTLDNRRSNLRSATSMQNRHNSASGGRSSRFKGVSRLHAKWAVYIKPHSKQLYLGSFDDEVLAAKVYDTAALHYFGEFACTNASLGLLPSEVSA